MSSCVLIKVFQRVLCLLCFAFALVAIASAIAFASPTSRVRFEGSEYPVITAPDINRKTNMVKVGTVNELTKAVSNAKPGDSIYILPGVYKLTEIKNQEEQNYKQRNNLIFSNVNDVLIRSSTGNPKDVIIKGSGFHKTLAGPSQYIPQALDILFSVGQGAYGISFYGLTIEDSNAYGIYLKGEHNVHDILIQNCKFNNVNQYALKGSFSYDPESSARTSNVYVIDNEFYATALPLVSDHFAEFKGNYIGAIDIMVLENAVIADNVIRDIHGASGEALGATLLWNSCKNIIYERNLIYDCDQGVAFGNSVPPVYSKTANYHVKNGIFRNNVVSNCSWDLFEICYNENTRVYNNTLVRTDSYNAQTQRGIRDSVGTSHNVEIKNNIIRRGMLENIAGGKRGYSVENNLISDDLSISYFVDAENHDFRLTKNAVDAIGKALRLPEVYNDFDLRLRTSSPDLGAFEYSAAAPPPGFGGMLSLHWIIYITGGLAVSAAGGIILKLNFDRKRA